MTESPNEAMSYAAEHLQPCRKVANTDQRREPAAEAMLHSGGQEVSV